VGVSSSEVEHLEELAVDSSSHPEHDSEALPLLDVDLHRLVNYPPVLPVLQGSILARRLNLELRVQRQDLHLRTQPADRPHDSHVALRALAYDVLDDQRALLAEVGVGADRLVNLG
jgi:hypothetical protein